MPSESAKQHRFMEAVDHDPKFAKKVGVPQKVGREFVTADKKDGYRKGHQSHEAKRAGSQLNQRLGVLPRKHRGR